MLTSRNLLLAAVLTIALTSSAFAQTGDVIITHDGVSDAAVRAAVEATGGVVKVHYANVPVTAARLGAALTLAGATVDEDAVLTLPEEDNPSVPAPLALAVPDAPIISGLGVTGGAPAGCANYLYTGASTVWEQTAYGMGSIVAVVDTGVVPNACIANAIIGAPGYPQGFNATDDELPATAPENHWHGTFVSGVIASNCGLCLPVGDVVLYAAAVSGVPVLEGVCGSDAYYLPVVGQAPLAQIYPVKVIRAGETWYAGTTLFQGLDHVLTLKKSGALDIDIVNMSLGGPTLQERGEPMDRFLRAFADAGILVVVSAGNSGPKPNSVGSPGSSLATVAVAAVDYAPSSRFFYEYFGLVYGFDGDPSTPDGMPGMGQAMHPSDTPRIALFSSRGPTSDGRSGPDLAALGVYNFHAVQEGFMWGTGTSFASPTVAGAAALLNAWHEASGSETDPAALRDALLAGADPTAVGPAWRDLRDQGAGVVDVPASLAALASQTSSGFGRVIHVGRLEANVLGLPRVHRTEAVDLGRVSLTADETLTVIVEIADVTSRVTFTLAGVDTPFNGDAVLWPNTLQVDVQGAERTALPSTFAFAYGAYEYGPDASLTVEDGAWTVDFPWGSFLVAQQPIQPGFLKLTLAGSSTNAAAVAFDLAVERADDAPPPAGEVVFQDVEIDGDEVLLDVVTVPEGTAVATFDLDWSRMWDRFPTSDLDMFIADPDVATIYYEGSTWAAPEQVVVYDPAPGDWYVQVVGYAIPLPTRFTVRATFE